MNREIRIPKQKRSIEKKNRIIKAAYTLFNEKGYHNTNTAQIAKEAGLSTGCLYDYFIDKQDIFMEVLKLHNEEIARLIRTKLFALPMDMDLLSIIKQLIHVFMEAHNHSKGFHQEVMALSFSDNRINPYIHSYENPAILSEFLAYFKSHHISFAHENEKILLLLNTIDHLCHELIYKEHQIIDQNTYICECAYMLEAMLSH